MTAFIQALAEWLEDNAAQYNIQRWFVFATHKYQDGWATEPNGMRLIDSQVLDGALTPMGDAYRQAALTPLTATLALAQGWNLVGLPLVASPALTAQGLCQALDTAAGVTGAAAELLRWDGAGQQYVGYTCPAGQGTEADFALQPGQAYWVRATQGISWVSPGYAVDSLDSPIGADWNLLHLPFLPPGVTTARTLCQRLDTALGTSGATVELFRWDRAGQRYASHACAAPLVHVSDFTLAPGEGYFVRATATGVFPLRR